MTDIYSRKSCGLGVIELSVIALRVFPACADTEEPTTNRSLEPEQATISHKHALRYNVSSSESAWGDK